MPSPRPSRGWGEAIDAAVAAQRALLAEAWPDEAPIRVRIGVHTGEAEERDGDYFGSAVNRAARVMDAGHGGQVLLSEVTASTIRPPRREMVGRRADVERIRAAVARDRLVTITGAGGVGKTRLALEVGNALVAEVTGGVALVDLSTVSDHTLVAAAMAEGVGLTLGGLR